MSEVPILIKILAILAYISGVFCILGGLAFLLMGEALSALFVALFPAAYFVILGSGLSLPFTIFMFGFGVLNFFLGGALWEGKNWARILMIIIESIIAILSLISIISGNFSMIFSLIISLLIGGYLAFNKSVKNIFR